MCIKYRCGEINLRIFKDPFRSRRGRDCDSSLSGTVTDVDVVSMFTLQNQEKLNVSVVRGVTVQIEYE